MGECPVYSVTYHRNGEVSYSGKGSVEHVGERRGRLSSVEDFVALTRFLERSGFEALRSEYPVAIDAPGVVITVTYSDGRPTKSVSGGADHPELWAVERVLDGLLLRVHWIERIAG